MIEPHRHQRIQHQETQDSDCIQSPSNAPLVKSKTISCGSSLNARNFENRTHLVPARNKPDVLQELSFKVPSQSLIAQPDFSTSFVGATRPSSPSYERIGNRYKRLPARAASEFIPGWIWLNKHILGNTLSKRKFTHFPTFHQHSCIILSPNSVTLLSMQRPKCNHLVEGGIKLRSAFIYFNQKACALSWQKWRIFEWWISEGKPGTMANMARKETQLTKDNLSNPAIFRQEFRSIISADKRVPIVGG